MQKFDCIIVGGGLVGLTTALALAQKNFSVAVIEAGKFDFAYDDKDYDLRVSAITRASENIFKNLQVWDVIVADRVSPYEGMRVWEQAQEGNIEFSAKKLSEPNLGHIIENRVMRKHLFQKLNSFPNAVLFSEHKCFDLYHYEDEIILQLEGGEEIAAKLIIGADGARSWVRNRGEFQLDEKPYNHNAIVATIRTELPHKKIARQSFLSNGILALLPLAEANTCSIVWSAIPESSNELMTLSKEDFSSRLTEASSEVLGKISCVSERATFPLFMRHVKTYVKPRIALIGDAAHTVHPLAGQGVNLGFLDAACLVDTLEKTRSKSRDFGLMQNLRKYERARKGENQLMLLAMLGFKNLFAKDSNAIIWARNLGLNLTNKADVIKYLFVRKALGMIGDAPSLAK